MLEVDAYSEEVKHVKERGWRVVVLDNIASYAEVDKACAEKVW
jgi:hypothetical protein